MYTHLLHFDTPTDDVVAAPSCFKNQLLTLRNNAHLGVKCDKSGFRPFMWTYRLNWARRTP